jgi:predicted alpha/beta superfamily hydrolase
VRQQRKIFVYVPAAYKDGTKAPILVTLDGPSQLKLVRNALDNLTISKDPARSLPTFIAIAVETAAMTAREASAASSMTPCPTASPDSSTTKCCRPC